MGWTLGYRSITEYFAFWLSTVLVALTADRIARRFFSSAEVADHVVRVAVLAFAIVVGCELVLGSVGFLSLGPVLTMFAALLVVSVRWYVRGIRLQADHRRVRLKPDTPETTSKDDGLNPDATETISWSILTAPVFPVAVIASLIVFMVGYGLTHSPVTLYDSVSYHLFFAARWFHEHRLSIIPTPFSDEAQAYAPGNGELFLLWLMLPLNGDLVARMGQLPFYCLAGVALFALARRSGARVEHAIYAPAFFMLARPVVGQAIGANVDLICAAMFLTSLYLGIAALDRDASRDWAIWGVSVGLYSGTKYLALVYLPVLLLTPLILKRGVRAKALWAVPGMLAFAAPWYVRNWVIAGSPIYPASLQAAGLTIAQGAFGRATMLDTVFHTGEIRLLPAIAAHAFGPTLFVVWLPVFLVAGALVIVRRQWWPAGWLMMTPVLMFPLEWFGIPVNVDSRFLLPAVAAATMAFAFTFGRNRPINAGVHALYAAAMIWILVGKHAEIPANLPWFMGGWLSLDGVIDVRFASWFAAIAAAFAIVCVTIRRRPAWRVTAVGLIGGVVSIALVVAAPRTCLPSLCDYLQTESPFIRANYLSGWRWIGENVQHATFAYTGINLPYPLSGERLTNRVYYVNIDRHPDWRFHDYARARRRRTSDSGQLARASGELVPSSERARAGNEALRARYERMDGDRDRWLENLKLRHVDHLFVAAMSAYEIDWQWHNGQGFPIEDEWARADPAMFPLLYENPQVRIYGVDFTRRSGA